MGEIYPGQLAARIGCDHLLPTPALHEGSAVQGQSDRAPTWSVAVHWVHWPWGFPGGPGQGQLPPVFCLEPSSMSYKVTFRWLLLVLGLEIPRRSQAVNLGWLLLVPDL